MSRRTASPSRASEYPSIVPILIVAALAGLALLAPVLPLADPAATDLARRLRPPFSEGHLLGTDQLGRDMLARLVWGTQTSLSVAVLATIISATLGSAIGFAAGYGGRWVDALLMRPLEVLMAIPTLLLILAIVAVLGPGLGPAMLGIAIANVPFFARTIRGVVLSLMRLDFVAAARLSGKSDLRIVLSELLANVLPALLAASSAVMGWMLIEAAGLGFLGLGAQSPQAELGSMIGEARNLLQVAPHIVLLPALVILILAISINLVGDGLRDLLDPRLRGARSARPAPATLVRRGDAAVPAARAPDAVVDIAALQAGFVVDGRNRPVVSDLDLTVAAGEAVGLVGASGSGKTVTALSILRLVPSPPGIITGGSIRHHGEDLLAAPLRRLQEIRGRRIAYVFQNPASALDPLMTVGEQIAETLRRHRGFSKAEAEREAIELIGLVAIAAPEERAGAYPHELSGGERQRIALAIAVANEPELIVADEPTSALDSLTQATVLALLAALRQRTRSALLLVSHDLAVVARLCDRVALLKDGRIVDGGPADAMLAASRGSEARRIAPRPPSREGRTLLSLANLSHRYESRRSWLREAPPAIEALHEVSFDVAAGSTLGIVGGSGSGKTTLARIIAGLVRPTFGSVLLAGKPIDGSSQAGRRALYRRVQYAFQDAQGALNPRHTVRRIIEAPLALLAGLPRGTRAARVEELMALVGLAPELAGRHPHELSGGQLQRVGLARALANEPELLILDEPVSALDAPARAEMKALLATLKAERGMTLILIAHDIGVVRALADEVLVLFEGRIVEQGPTSAVFDAPRHAYTRALIEAVP